MSKSEIVRSGGCLCGAIRYEIKSEPEMVGVCHCSMCQRWGGNAFGSWAGFSSDVVDWNKDPAFYKSSDRGSYLFCPKCGSSLGFRESGHVWIGLGSLDHPDQLRPDHQWFTDSELPWIHSIDTIPGHGSEYDF